MTDFDDKWLDLVSAALKIPAPSQASVNRAYTLISARATARQPSVRGAVVQMMQMISDSLTVPNSALGIRSTPTRVRHLLFACPTFDMTLRIEPQAEGFLLAGQLLGIEGASEVRLLGPRSQVAQVLADEEFQFTFMHVAPGRYHFAVATTSEQFETPTVEVGSFPLT